MTRKKSAFDRFVDEQMQSPSFAEEYAKASEEIRAVDDLIRAIDGARIDAGMTKTELAQKLSASPAAIRRLLTSGDANPTFKTVLEVLHALNLRISITSSPAKDERPAAKTQKMKSVPTSRKVAVGT